jgi:predicted lipid-binding transport protein (Tim44 family)
LKFSVLLFATLYLVFLVAGLVLWAAATATGLRENIETFIGDLIASDDFEILGPTMLRASVLGGLLLVVMGTGASVLLTVLYNLISDVIGGVTIVFEERPSRRNRRLLETATAPAQPAPSAPAVLTPRRGLRRPPPGGPRPPDTTPMPDMPVQVQPEQVETAELSRRPSD